jgi:zinc transport system substrate-binding protein
MKKISLWCILLFWMLVLTGCGSNNLSGKDISVICTTFVQYDWLSHIIGEDNEKIELTFLLDNGVDMHSYQPTAADIAKLSGCDAIICVGGESEQWLDGVLNTSVNPDIKKISLMELIEENVKEEEIVEGMQEEGHGHESDGQAEADYDEHVWLSLKNAELLCEKLTQVMISLDAEQEERYRSNAAAYISSLKALDEQYEKAVAEGVRKTVLFGDRFPFRYLTDDYGLTYYAAFAGCSADAEASFETIAFLIDKVNTLELPVVFTIDQSDQTLARTIVESTTDRNQKILSLDSMQSVTAKDLENGTSYLSVMEKNLELLKEALN